MPTSSHTFTQGKKIHSWLHLTICSVFSESWCVMLQDFQSWVDCAKPEADIPQLWTEDKALSEL